MSVERSSEYLCLCGRRLGSPEHFKLECTECMLELSELKPDWFSADGTLKKFGVIPPKQDTTPHDYQRNIPVVAVEV